MLIGLVKGAVPITIRAQNTSWTGRAAAAANLVLQGTEPKRI